VKVEIHLNILEFRNSISNYIIIDKREDGWVKIRGIEDEYYYKEFNGYAVLVSHDFPLEKGYIFDNLKVDKLREILDQPGRVKYYITLEITEKQLKTTEEDCLDDFPGIDIVNGMLNDFKFEKGECCVKIVSLMESLEKFKDSLERIIKGFQLYYSIIKKQEEIAVEIAKKFLTNK